MTIKINLIIKKLLLLFITIIFLIHPNFKNKIYTEFKIKNISHIDNFSLNKKLEILNLQYKKFLLHKNKIFEINKKYIKQIKINVNLKFKKIISNKNFVIIKDNNDTITIIKKNILPIKFNSLLNEKITSNIKITNNNIFYTINDNKIVSLDLNTSLFSWQTIINTAFFNISSKSKILISNNKLYNITPNKRLIILKKQTGEIVLNKNIKLKEEKNIQKQKFFKKTMLYKNNIYIAYTDGSFVKLDGTTGNKIWQKTKYNYKDFAILNTRAAIIKNNGNITLLDTNSGKKLWTNKSLKKKNLHSINMSSFFNLALINENNEILHFINLKNGFIINSIKLNVENKITLLKNNLIYIKNNGKVIKIKLKK